MTNLIDIEAGYQAALHALQNAGVVALPTETVYGLAADATNADAVAKIYAAKGRPSFNPLISHVSGLEMAQRFGKFDGLALRLAQEFWPGPLTLVVKSISRHTVADAVTAGLETIALRHPSGVMARLSADLDAPIAAPSANTSGRISPTEAHHVAQDLGTKVDVILDGGPCPVGLESTILLVEDEKATLLRAGGLSIEKIEALIGPVARAQPTKKIQSPGMLLAHYAPSIPVRLNAKQAEAGEAALTFGDLKLNSDIAELNLSPSADLDEAARNLFSMMQILDGSGATSLAVAPVPHHGLGVAINDRLTRAAHGARSKIEQVGHG